jgi:hypothetical protein
VTAVAHGESVARATPSDTAELGSSADRPKTHPGAVFFCSDPLRSSARSDPRGPTPPPEGGKVLIEWRWRREPRDHSDDNDGDRVGNDYDGKCPKRAAQPFFRAIRRSSHHDLRAADDGTSAHRLPGSWLSRSSALPGASATPRPRIDAGLATAAAPKVVGSGRVTPGAADLALGAARVRRGAERTRPRAGSPAFRGTRA